MNETLEKTPHEASDVRQLRAYIDDLLTAGIRPSRIAVESGVSLQRLNIWINGSGGENVIPALLAWKSEVESAALGQARGFVMTPTAQRIIKAFDRARLSQGGVAHVDGEGTEKRGIALVYGCSGVGKSESAEWYVKHACQLRQIGEWPVVLVECTGAEISRETLFANILASMPGAVFYPQMHEKKIDTIRSRIPDGGLIIFDEAQRLSQRRLDELRHLPDRCGIAIALMGNLTGYKELVDAKIAQLMGRVGCSAARVVVDLPTEGDVDALLEAREIRGREVREVALMIGIQDGGLRMLDRTIAAAKMLSKAKGASINADLFLAAAVSAGAWGVGL